MKILFCAPVLPPARVFRFLIRLSLFGLVVLWFSGGLTGCSAGKQGLLQITPQQYFYSSKEKLETIDERAYEIRDLDEIIRVMENAEKDARSAEIMDKSRLYLVLLNSMKARKQFQANRLKGTYLANRPEPYYQLDTKPAQETLRVAKKWLRALEAQFKTKAILPDLHFVKALYYTQKMLTQREGEARASLWIAVDGFRRCLALAPAYKADFRLFGRLIGPREVRLRMAETLALGGELIDAYSLVADYRFSPSQPRLDYPWAHMLGLVLAQMGRYEEAAKILSTFKIVPPQDYPPVDDALWLLEGVYDRLKETTKDLRFGTEAKIVASLLKALKGPYSTEKYTTASHLFPRWMPGDARFFDGLVAFVAGDFQKAADHFEAINKRGLLARSNRLAARVLRLENLFYAGKALPDEGMEELLSLSSDPDFSPLLRERIGSLLGRILMAQDKKFKPGKLDSEGMWFTRQILEKPIAFTIRYEKGKVLPEDPKEKKTRRREPIRDSSSQLVGLQRESQPRSPEKRDESSLIVEVFANRAEDWLTSVNLNLVELPTMKLLGKGRVVGREEEGQGWVFKSSDIDELRPNGKYLALLEYTNSDSEKTYQGSLFTPIPFKAAAPLGTPTNTVPH